MTNKEIHPRHLLGLDGLSASGIERVLDRAEAFLPTAKGDEPPLDDLRGTIIANLFFEASTRTRMSFTIAARRLGADVVDLAGDVSSRSKGESLLDTCRNLEAMGVKAFVIRTNASGAAHQVARRLMHPVINAGDGRHEHPTQGLTDLMTMRQRLGDLAGRTVAIVGDIANSRVARSGTFGLTTLGARVLLVGPLALAPREMEKIEGCGRSGRVEVVRDLDAALPHLDAIVMLRVQFERAAGEAIPSIDEYRRGYALTAKRVAFLPEHAVILHPGPINRGLELDDAVADDPSRSVILQQVTNGVAVRMAVLSEALSS